MWLLAAPHKDEKKEKYNPPLHPSLEGNKKLNNERTSKKFPSNGGVSRSDRVGVVYFFTIHHFPFTIHCIYWVSRSDWVGVVYSVILSGVFPRENLIFKSF